MTQIIHVFSREEEDGQRRPVAFISRKLFDRERRPFKLKTDHRAVQWLENMRDTNSRVTRWYLSLQPYNFTVEYRPGASNRVADFLSRIPESNLKLLQDLLQQTGSSSLDTKDTVKYIKKIRGAPNPERCINLFHCLNELNDHSLVEEVQGYLRKGHKPRDLSLSQLSALAFVLLMSDQELEEFDLGDYGGWSSPARSDAGLLRMLPVAKTSRAVK
ncbi:hypothetical protein ACEWY4_005960 [Coilia grayii]|uniref:Reverse transcriptase RNase H-like domain-containing protein n=1 Tax=Coilia grayii TaxID=363190 RepID=A0ABD1KD26_9TELE